MTRSRGFTLVELIMVMVIIGIVSAAVSVFIVGPVSGYVDANRRAQLSDSADTALRRMTRDVRLALPNSIRVGGNQYLEFIPTTTGSRYYTQGNNRLDFTAADNSFGYLGTLESSLIARDDFVVIFNTGQRSASGCATAPGGADAYEGCNRTAIDSVSTSAVTLGSSFRFPFESPGNRFHVVPKTGPVTYACETVGTNANGDGTGTLRIYTNYVTGTDWGSTAPTAAPGGTPSLLAQYVSGCNFIYTSGVTASNGLVTLRLTLTRRNETITLHHQVHVDNVP